MSYELIRRTRGDSSGRGIGLGNETTFRVRIGSVNPSRRLTTWLPWLAALAVAALLRAPDLGAGWPYINYVDEGHLLRPAALALRAGSWDTGDFNYPTLPAYLAAGTVAAGAWLRGAGPALPVEGLYEQRYYDVTPPPLLRAGRAWSLALSLGTVLVVGLLAQTLASSQAGWLAAWIAAWLPALVIRGGNANVDIMAAFFCALAFLGAERTARESSGWRNAALAGLVAGLAVTSKYTMALVLPAIGLRLLLADAPWPRKGRALATIAGAGAGGLVLGMPALVLAPGRVWQGITTQSSRYREIDLGELWAQAVRRAEWNHPFEHAEVGFVFLALALLGGVWLARERRGRMALLVMSLFAVALLLPLLAYAFRPFRNLLPVVALACPLAGVALSELATRPRWRGGIAAAALVPVVLYGPAVGGYAVSRFGLEDSRREAVDWLVANVAAGPRICVAREIAVLPAELARLPAGAVFVPALDGRFAAQWHECTVAVLPAKALDAGTWLCTEGALPSRVPCFEELQQFGDRAVPLDPSLYRGNRQRLSLLKRRDPG